MNKQITILALLASLLPLRADQINTNAVRSDPELAEAARGMILQFYPATEVEPGTTNLTLKAQWELKRRNESLALLAAALDTNQTDAATVAVTNSPAFLSTWTNPASLPNACWTNYLAKTNGRSFQLWSTYTLPEGWPTQFSGMPALAWDKNCLVYGAAGLSALCQCHTGQGARGQVPMIAITRRHLVSRGHGMGVATPTNGPVVFPYAVKLYFCAPDNTVVEATAVNKGVYFDGTNDFSIISLAADLPASIVPVRCINPATWRAKFPTGNSPAPSPLIGTRQTGFLDCGANSGHNEAVSGGDSGSPGFLWLGNELFFAFQVSGSGPVVPQAQAGVDVLSGLLGVSAASYQIQYFDLSGYP